jgi:lysophospholipase L1-like esterase
MSSMAPPVHAKLDDTPALQRPSGPPSWRSVARRRVYFGHQSVGRDIIGGLELLDREHGLGMRFVQTRQPSAVAGPAFVDFLAGENTRPATKNRAFMEQLDARPTRDGAVAMLKYCYVDISERTDTQKMFDEYRRTIETIRTRHPDVTVVHLTVPITSVESAAKAQLKSLLGRPTLRAANARRAEYNALVRGAFAGREPLVDVAAIEASGPRSVPNAQGGRGHVEALDDAFTHDGGHLNALGARAVAAAMLDVLGALASVD